MADRRIGYRLKLVCRDYERVGAIYRRFRRKDTGWACPVCGEPDVDGRMHPRGYRFRHSDRLGDQCCVVQSHDQEPPVGMHVGRGPVCDDDGQVTLF